MTPGAPPPSTPDPRRFLPSRRPISGSQQDTPGPRQFQPSGAVASSSQRFQATPRFAPPSSAHNTTPRPTPSTQAFLLPGSVRSTQRRDREQIYDVPSSSPAGFPSPVPAGKGVDRESIEVESEIDVLEESQSVIADSAGEYEDDGDGPAPKRRRTRPLSETSDDGREETAKDVTQLDDGHETDLMDHELDDELAISPPDLDDEMDLSDHERRGNPEQQPKFLAAPRFKLPETEEAPADGLPEAFSPQRRGAKYVHGGMAAEMQSWLADVRAWTGHDRPPDAVMRVVVDEIRPGNAMYLVRGRRLLRDEAVADPGAPGLRIMLAGEGKSTGLARKAAVGVGSVVLVSQPVWEVPLKGDGRWVVVCEWAVEAI